MSSRCKERVLMVDELWEQRDIHAPLLRVSGYEVVAAEDGRRLEVQVPIRNDHTALREAEPATVAAQGVTEEGMYVIGGLSAEERAAVWRLLMRMRNAPPRKRARRPPVPPDLVTDSWRAGHSSSENGTSVLDPRPSGLT